ncbi:MAG TPA: hypothetical protein VIJ44_00320, partial [Acidimicrobiia bacterium]
IRDLHGLDFDTRDGLDLSYAHYEHNDLQIHVAVGYLPMGDLPTASRVIARHLAENARDRDVVLDLVMWSPGPRPEVEVTAKAAADLLAECDFGRPLHRIDLTITWLEGGGP